MLQQRPMDWTHRLFNRARSSRSQTLTDNQTVRLSIQVLLRATPASPPPTVRIFVAENFHWRDISFEWGISIESATSSPAISPHLGDRSRSGDPLRRNQLRPTRRRTRPLRTLVVRSTSTRELGILWSCDIPSSGLSEYQSSQFFLHEALCEWTAQEIFPEHG